MVAIEALAGGGLVFEMIFAARLLGPRSRHGWASGRLGGGARWL